MEQVLLEIRTPSEKIDTTVGAWLAGTGCLPTQLLKSSVVRILKEEDDYCGQVMETMRRMQKKTLWMCDAKEEQRM